MQDNDNNPGENNPLDGENRQDLYRDARHYRPKLVWHYAAKSWFRRAETSVLYGPSNCGKSALVCHLGYCIVTGSNFFGARVKQGIVVHVGAEAPESVLDRMQAYDLESAPHTSPYVVRMAPVDLSDSDAVETFICELKKLHGEHGEKIILIVFDTLARSIGATDENCAASMTQVAKSAERIARTLKAHVMLVHHTGKDTDRGGRGSSALRGAVDTEISLIPLKTGDVRVAHEKQRTMRKGEPTYFRTESFVLGFDEDGEDRTTVKAVEVSESAPSEAGKKAGTDARYDVAILTALHIRGMTGSNASKPFRPNDIVETIPPEFFGDIKAESRQRNIARALANLASRENAVIEKVGDAWRLVARGAGASSEDS
jgi:hypothetical protein